MIPLAATLKSIQSQLKNYSNYIPSLGELLIDKDTMMLKVGDGKTNIANLPYVEGDAPQMTLSEQARKFIENNIEYLDVDDYETFYSKITTVALAKEVSKALFKAGLNPKEHLKQCPRGCEYIFDHEGEDDPDATIKTKGWANIKNPHINTGKTEYQWVPNGEKYWDWVSYYKIDIDTAVETIKKKIDYLELWTLEEDE